MDPVSGVPIKKGGRIPTLEGLLLLVKEPWEVLETYKHTIF